MARCFRAPEGQSIIVIRLVPISTHDAEIFVEFAAPFKLFIEGLRALASLDLLEACEWTVRAPIPPWEAGRTGLKWIKHLGPTDPHGRLVKYDYQTIPDRMIRSERYCLEP